MAHSTFKARTLAVIPARYGSTRFPGKPLALLGDERPMIAHVVERAQAVPGLDRVIVATDDPGIFAAVEAIGAEAMMTRSDHPTGTDRIQEVVTQLEMLGEVFDLILNLQGDEPEMPSSALSGLIQAMQDNPSDIATLVCPLTMPHDMLLLENPNVVKAVVTLSGQALYFSRSPIPYCRNPQQVIITPYYRHLGVYLYTANSLKALALLPPSPLEEAECLEQLRALEAGLTITTHSIPLAPIGVDTPEDLQRLLAGNNVLAKVNE